MSWHVHSFNQVRKDVSKVGQWSYISYCGCDLFFRHYIVMELNMEFVDSELVCSLQPCAQGCQYSGATIFAIVENILFMTDYVFFLWGWLFFFKKPLQECLR